MYERGALEFLVLRIWDWDICASKLWISGPGLSVKSALHQHLAWLLRLWARAMGHIEIAHEVHSP